MRVDGAKGWKSQLRDAGPEWTLTATCPSCATLLAWNVQPGPWSVPAHATTGERLGVDGHLAGDPAEFGKFEQARAAGKLEHDDADRLAFQLFCHRCQISADATIVGGAP